MQSRNKPIFIAALFLPLLALGGCGSQVTAKAVNLTTGIGTGTGTGIATSTTPPLTVTVQTGWDPVPSVLTTEKTCTVPAGTNPGDPAAEQLCTAYIPEEQLYLSQLVLSVAIADENECAIINFQPYFYQISNSATFTPNGATTPINCSGAATVTPFGPIPVPATCYNGPATTLVSGFPAYGGIYYLSALGLTHSYANIASANSFALTSPKFTNTWTANNLDGPPSSVRTTNINGSSAPPLIGDGYVANSMHDYVFQCMDPWGQPVYSITLVISDDPSASGFLPPPTYVPTAQRSAWYLYP